MPTKYAGRVLTILVVMYVALSCIYPRAPFSIFLPLQQEPASWRHTLKPGIDMVGGTSLLYEIEATDNAASTSGLSNQVADALKRRVDPNGVLNLIWRPQGDTRLEIQMPLSGDSARADAVRQTYLAAQKELAALNVPLPQVVSVVESLGGPDREARLAELTQGSDARREAFAALASAFDALQVARSNGTIPEQQAAEQAYEAAKRGVEATNLPIDEVQVALEARPDVRKTRLEALAVRNAGFPQRQAALDAYAAAHEQYVQVKDEIGDTASLKRLLRGSGVLEFHILADDVPPATFQEYFQRLQAVGPRPRAGDEFRWYAVDRPEALGGRQMVTGPDGNQYVLAYASGDRALDDRDPEWGLARAFPDQDQNGGNAVGFEFDAMGARLFGELTGQNVNRPLAVILDNRVISAPTINQQITARGVITGGSGGFSSADAGYLINTLNAGALPARLAEDPLVERSVGPQLGEDNLRAGLYASVFGLLITAFFLIAYYYLAGVVATFAVLLNMVLILGAMAMLNATFTLPGIAGIILSIGMAVDANVLIFERLREEQARGLSIRMALRNAYDRAFSAILDSNITTGITAFILYRFGSEEVAGFGLTLLIGIFASLFTALYVTRTVFGLLVDRFGIEDLGSLPRSYPRWDRMLTPNIDWMSKARLFGLVSAVIVGIGLVLFGWAFRKGNVLDIEFAGGTTAQFELREAMPISEVRRLLSDDAGPLAGAQIVALEPAAGLPNDTSYEVVVSEKDNAAVTGAIVGRLGDRLNIRAASTFADSERDFDAAMIGTRLFPITEDAADVDGLPVPRDALAANTGGVAVVLRDLQPMLSREELQARFDQQRLRGVYDAEGLRGGVNATVETFPDQNAAVVLVSNERFGYDADNADVIAEWRAELAGPTWQLLRDAVANPEQLQRVTNIGAQVAGEFQRDALIALVLSVLTIMAYVWIRFGDLKFGGATVVALAHDTLFCVAAIGYAHLLTAPWLLGGAIGDALLLDPFRLNLTMVAAILTVMGFSMNDTVVVFDRIRENRGKYGMLTGKVINDSINQTLSRTLLTGGTTIVTIFVMYVFGGPGIHGFTFAMLVGIVTGTYSSIAIASPLLLWGRAEAAAPAPMLPSHSKREADVAVG